jgi:hypothetical protein
MLSIDHHLRRCAGIHQKTSRAKNAPPAVPAHLLPGLGNVIALSLAAVVFTVTVDMALAVPELSVTFGPLEQVGRSIALAGLEVTTQMRVTVPA